MQPFQVEQDADNECCRVQSRHERLQLIAHVTHERHQVGRSGRVGIMHARVKGLLPMRPLSIEANQLVAHRLELLQKQKTVLRYESVVVDSDDYNHPGGEIVEVQPFDSHMQSKEGGEEEISRTHNRLILNKQSKT